MVQHRASPDVKIYKAYGLFSFYIDFYNPKPLINNNMFLLVIIIWNTKICWKHMGLLMMNVTSDIVISPTTGLDKFIEVRHRASPDVKISKAYGLFSFLSVL